MVIKPNKIKIIIICGPTASGKSKLAVDLALKFNGEIINADSMQIYKGMDIANATPTTEEMNGIVHHLFGFVEPSSSFDVVQWLRKARENIIQIVRKGKLPIIVGGTGLYITSLVDNIIFDDVEPNLDFRNKMQALAKEHGNSYLLKLLREVDPKAADKLHENNTKRIIRSLEAFEQSGQTLDERLKLSRANASPYEPLMLGINFRERKDLYKRIDRRVDLMVENGIIDEARVLQNLSSDVTATSSQAIGHKELMPFLRGEKPIDECVENLKTKTRNYAKRQLTWFRKDERIKWLIMDDNVTYNCVLDRSFDIVVEFLL